KISPDRRLRKLHEVIPGPYRWRIDFTPDLETPGTRIDLGSVAVCQDGEFRGRNLTGRGLRLSERVYSRNKPLLWIKERHHSGSLVPLSAHHPEHVEQPRKQCVDSVLGSAARTGKVDDDGRAADSGHSAGKHCGGNPVAAVVSKRLFDSIKP